MNNENLFTAKTNDNHDFLKDAVKEIFQQNLEYKIEKYLEARKYKKMKIVRDIGTVISRAVELLTREGGFSRCILKKAD